MIYILSIFTIFIPFYALTCIKLLVYALFYSHLYNSTRIFVLSHISFFHIILEFKLFLMHLYYITNQTDVYLSTFLLFYLKIIL